MSLDVYLARKRDEPTAADRAVALFRANGLEEFAAEIEARHECGDVEVYSANITHNLGRMADAAGIYAPLWRPEEVGITKAAQLIEPLRAGLEKLRNSPAHYRTFNSPNGWGLYEHFVPFVAAYLAACEENPDADVSVSR